MPAPEEKKITELLTDVKHFLQVTFEAQKLKIEADEKQKQKIEANRLRFLNLREGILKSISENLQPESYLKVILTILINHAVYNFTENDEDHRLYYQSFKELLLKLDKCPKLPPECIQYADYLLLAVSQDVTYQHSRLRPNVSHVELSRLLDLREIVAKIVYHPIGYTGKQLRIANWILLNLFFDTSLINHRNQTKDEKEKAQLKELMCFSAFSSLYDRIKEERTVKDTDKKQEKCFYLLIDVYNSLVLYNVEKNKGQSFIPRLQPLLNFIHLDFMHSIADNNSFLEAQFIVDGVSNGTNLYVSLLAYYKLLFECAEYKYYMIVNNYPEKILTDVNHPQRQQYSAHLDQYEMVMKLREAFYDRFKPLDHLIALDNDKNKFVHPDNKKTLKKLKIDIKNSQAKHERLSNKSYQEIMASSSQPKKKPEETESDTSIEKEDVDEEETVTPSESPTQPNDNQQSISRLITARSFKKAEEQSKSIIATAKNSNNIVELAEGYSCLADTYFAWAKYDKAKLKSAEEYYKYCDKTIASILADPSKKQYHDHLQTVQSLARERYRAEKPSQSTELKPPVATPSPVAEPSPVQCEALPSKNKRKKKKLIEPASVLTVQPQPSPPVNDLKTTLKQALPPKVVQTLLQINKIKGAIAYLTGGAIRDWIISQNTKKPYLPNDFDICVTARHKEITDLFKDEGQWQGSNYPVYVIKTKAGIIIQISLMQTTDQHRQYQDIAEVKPNQYKPLNRTTNLAHNMSVRDVTANALFYDIRDDRIIDLCNGIQHIHENRIVFINPTEEAVKFDASLILRMTRLAIMGMQLSSDDSNVFNQYTDKLKDLNIDKLNLETTKTLQSVSLSAVLAYFKRYGFWERVYGLTPDAAKRCKQSLTALAQLPVAPSYALLWSIIGYDRYMQAYHQGDTVFTETHSKLGILHAEQANVAMVIKAHALGLDAANSSHIEQAKVLSQLKAKQPSLKPPATVSLGKNSMFTASPVPIAQPASIFNSTVSRQPKTQ